VDSGQTWIIWVIPQVPDDDEKSDYGKIRGTEHQLRHGDVLTREITVPIRDAINTASSVGGCK